MNKELYKKILPSPVFSLLKKIYFKTSFTYQYITVKKAFEQNKRFSFLWKDRYPQLYDNTSKTGFDRHYIYHPAWAARIIKKNNPQKHIDISSALSFSTIVSAFIPVDFYDYRPAELELAGLKTKSGDLMKLPFADNSVESISCMHTIEHIGLGRYGDPIDPDADLKAIKELKRVLAPGGSLLFVTPVGKPKIMYNAHRIYSYRQINEYFSDLNLEEFSLIPEKSGPMIYNAVEADSNKEDYACGCFWFKK